MNNRDSVGAASDSSAVTAADRGLIRELLKELVAVADKLTIVGISRLPVDGSIAHSQLESVANAGLPITASYVRTAHVSLIFANSAGFDHARAFINSVNSKTFSFSLATLTRGSLEAFAKSYYLMNTNEAGELLSRHISLTRAEMTAAAKHNSFRNQNGVPTDIDEHLRKSRQHLASLGLPLITGAEIGATRLVTTLLDESADADMGRKLYSQLSGVAHGESAALGMFLVAGPSEVRFRIPRELVVEYAGMICASCVLVVDRMVEMFGLEPEYQAQWNGAKSRAVVTLNTLQARFPANSDV